MADLTAEEIAELRSALESGEDHCDCDFAHDPTMACECRPLWAALPRLLDEVDELRAAIRDYFNGKDDVYLTAKYKLIRKAGP